jgi:hypothetical protein
MSARIPPLDPETAALLASEKRIEPVPAVAQGRALDAVLERLRLGTHAKAEAAPPRPARFRAPAIARAVGPHIVTFALGVATGMAWHSAAGPPRSRASDGSIPAASSTAAARPAPVPSGNESAAPAPPRAAIVPAAPDPRPAPSTPPARSPPEDIANPDDTLAAEQALVDTARRAVGSGDGAAALTSLDRHRAQFPGGLLAEERDALTIKALTLVGRADDARNRARLFHARYPRSLLGAAVDRAADGAPDIPR